MTGEAPDAYCRREVRRLDYDRYLAALFAPAEARPGLLALYAFNLELARVPELVTEPLLGEVRLTWWREALAEARAGTPHHHPVALALAAALARRSLSPEHLERLIETRRLDLDGEPPATLADLVAYAEGTAATLVWLALEALGAASAPALAAGRHVGVAWALAGLMRALPYHARRRRLYLPAALLDEVGVAPKAVLAGAFTPALGVAVGTVLDMAEAHLDEARAYAPKVSRRALPALLPAALADLYIARLRSGGANPFAPGLELSGPRRLLRLARFRAGGRY